MKFIFKDIEGVIAFLSAKDIPGYNAFIKGEFKYFLAEHDEVVCCIQFWEFAVFYVNETIIFFSSAIRR